MYVWTLFCVHLYSAEERMFVAHDVRLIEDDISVVFFGEVKSVLPLKIG